MVKINNWDLFPELVAVKSVEVPMYGTKNRWKRLKSKNFGMEYCENAFFQGKYGIPQIRKYTGSIPDHLVTLDKINKMSGSSSIGIVPFSYDYILDTIADKPGFYVDKFSKFAFVGELDFSMKVEHCLAVVVANSFRSHAVAFYFQEHGCRVMPVMKWSVPQSFEVCFDGYERGGVVMISTVGVLSDERSRYFFTRGFSEMIRRVSPDALILYGDMPDWICQLMPSQLYVRHFEHERFKRLRRYGK